MAFVDTNVILRWLLGDHIELSPKAEHIVAGAKPGSLVITDVVTAEIVYVLRATGRDRQQTNEALQLLLRTDAFRFENEELTKAIADLLMKTPLDFADCYLLARSKREGAEVNTFDEPLKKRLND